jgi:hypothetical protein
MKPPYKPEQIFPLIDSLEGTDVDVYLYGVNRGGDTYRHKTNIGGTIEDHSDWQRGGWGASVKEVIEQGIAIRRAGIDPLSVLVQRGHEKGLQVWATFRMNDLHEDLEECAAFRSRFKIDHPELLMGSPYPEPKEWGSAEADFSWAFDYAHEEVRNRFLAIIEEALTNYDLDGVDLDFLRGPYYFKTGQREKGMPLLTDFMRKVRDAVSKVSKQKGKPLTLSVRVDPSFEACERAGLDVRTWIEEGLADLVTPMAHGRLDMNADVWEFVKVARAAGTCEIGGGIEGRTYGYGFLPDGDIGSNREPSIEILRAAAMGYYDQGAASLYLFNYYWGFAGQQSLEIQAKLQALKEIGNRQSIARKNKRYAVSIDNHPDLYGRAVSLLLQLPAPPFQRLGQQQRFTLWIGDDLDAARRHGVLEATRLRLTFGGLSYPRRCHQCPTQRQHHHPGTRPLAPFRYPDPPGTRNTGNE